MKKYEFCELTGDRLPIYQADLNKTFFREFKCPIHLIKSKGNCVWIHVKELTCPDERQAICLAQVINPDVEQIFVLSNGNDTHYFLGTDGWECRIPKTKYFGWIAPDA